MQGNERPQENPANSGNNNAGMSSDKAKVIVNLSILFSTSSNCCCCYYYYYYY